MLLRGTLPPTTTVEAPSDVGVVRRLAASAARAQGFDAIRESQLGLVATEMATNLVKHACGGAIRTILCRQQGVGGVILLSTDSGPGMADVRGNMVDGFSTAGTLGAGLGTIARASDLVDLYSALGRGTVLMSESWALPRPAAPPPAFRFGAIADAYPGEHVTGDAWIVEQSAGDVAKVMVVDGLGHGSQAERAAGEAVASFRRHTSAPVESIAAAIHADLRSTCGAALAVVSIDRRARLLRCCGVGNIAGRVFGGTTSSTLVSRFGIAGHQVRKLQAFELDWTADSLLVLHSDGVSARWELDAGGLRRHHPLVVAAIVMQDAGRRRDDATVLVIGENPDAVVGARGPSW